MKVFGGLGRTRDEFARDVVPSRRELGHRIDFPQKRVQKGLEEAIPAAGAASSWFLRKMILGPPGRGFRMRKRTFSEKAAFGTSKAT